MVSKSFNFASDVDTLFLIRVYRTLPAANLALLITWFAVSENIVDDGICSLKYWYVLANWISSPLLVFMLIIFLCLPLWKFIIFVLLVFISRPFNLQYFSRVFIFHLASIYEFARITRSSAYSRSSNSFVPSIFIPFTLFSLNIFFRSEMNSVKRSIERVSPCSMSLEIWISLLSWSCLFTFRIVV